MTTSAILTAPTIDDIRAAAQRIDGAIEKTPTSHSGVLSKMIGADLWLKFENLQYTAAYKERGALNKLLQLSDDERARGVIAASAGNHAQAVAYHGKRLGIPVTIVMPNPTPTVKVTQTEGHKARVVLHGETFDDAYDHARQMEAEEAMVFVHPFDDGQIIAGTGTIALEMLAEVPDLDVLVVPIGGGGLISGMAIAAKSLNPAIEIIGVEAELYPSMKNVVEGSRGRIGGDTLAEGIAVKEPGQLTRAIIADKVDSIELVAERDIEHAVALLVSIEKTVVEGAGAAGLAHILANPDRFAGRKVGTILCGGNIDTHLLANVLVRELVRCGRIARLKINAQDRPGALAAITAKFYECGVNIIEVEHQRIFTRLPAKDTLIEVECEARDAQAIETLITRLESAGFTVERAQLD
ncbi:MAG: threonine ammonia-lyase [Pseudomonadota bacterium]